MSLDDGTVEWVFCENVVEDRRGRTLRCGHKIAARLSSGAFEIRRREAVMTLVDGTARVTCPACDVNLTLIVNA